MHSAYKTLFYGLRRNQAHNVALVHLLLFVARRILYALVIVGMHEENVFWGALLLMLSSLAMVAVLTVERQWEDMLIAVQHFFNEVLFYLLCVGLLLFSGLLQKNHQNVLFGWLLISAGCVNILFNLGIIVADLSLFVRLLYARYSRTLLKLRLRRSLCLAKKNRKPEKVQLDPVPPLNVPSEIKKQSPQASPREEQPVEVDLQSLDDQKSLSMF